MKAKGKLFGGKESIKEEMMEAKDIKSGKVSPKEYAMKEKAEKGKGMKCGGKVKKYAKGGGIAQKGMKTCKMV